MSQPYNQTDERTLSAVSNALLDQVVTLGYAASVAHSEKVRLALQQAKSAHAGLLHDVIAHMWRLGLPASDHSSAVSLSRVADLSAPTADPAAAALRAIDTKLQELTVLIDSAVSADQLSGHTQNFLQTVMSRAGRATDDLDGVKLAGSDAETDAHDNLLAAKPLHILLVEDNPDVAAVTTDMLRHLGWQVTRTMDATSALAALTEAIDLIVSDVIMPGELDGLGLAREARKHRPQMPIVLTSGYVERVAQEARDAGIALLKKPYGLDDLSKAINAARPG